MMSARRRTLTPRGTLVIVGGEGGGQVLGGLERNLAAGLISPFVGQKLMGLVASERGDDFAELATLIEAGTITPSIDRVVPRADASDAVRALRAGVLRGKAVISVIE